MCNIIVFLTRLDVARGVITMRTGYPGRKRWCSTGGGTADTAWPDITRAVCPSIYLSLSASGLCRQASYTSMSVTGAFVNKLAYKENIILFLFLYRMAKKFAYVLSESSLCSAFFILRMNLE